MARRGFIPAGLMLLQIFQRKCNEVFTEIQLAVQKTYNGPHASLFVRNPIQHIKLRGHTRLVGQGTVPCPTHLR